jgi:EpsI family protein
MEGGRRLFRFLQQPVARAVTVTLLAQTGLFYALPRNENIPITRPLATYPHNVGPWVMLQEGIIEKDILDVLKADDTLNRTYTNGGKVPVNLFVAFFKTQRGAVAPHSPKVCLPGAGWIPTESSIVMVDVPGRNGPIPINRTSIARGEYKSVVLYWYQSRDRVVADEYRAKFYSMYDSIRYRRSDTALVRVVAPVVNDDETGARALATQFVQDIFAPLLAHLPT